MKYVLDASVALKTVLPEQDSDQALRLLDEFAAGLHQLVAPDVFAAEVANSLTRAERKRVIAPGDALVLYSQVLVRMPSLLHSLALLPRAIEISSQLRTSTYDCLYVALAEQENCSLITADRKLIATFSLQFPFIVNLADLT